ncbi:uncharacterized protein LOC102714972 [Oryza brachyantha]|uniref:uncharacterized protein LOC102714972 n=1 Tax=Oryza brachyantha TaxID=4533 RepID=UPI001ADBA009|nr:uncharacterized protein LOC102714972 [Oryza brachyantha]
MALVSRTWRWPRCFLFLMMACVCTSLITRCRSDEAAAAFHGQKRSTGDIVARAIICFNDRYIYSGCQEQYRLGPEGALHVPPPAAEAFCGGPCLAETNLVLGCVDGIMDSFRFYNGAAVGDVRLALDRGCGHTGLRGDFDVMRRLGGEGYYYGGGSSVRLAPRGFMTTTAAAPAPLLMGAVVGVLLWG